MAQALYINNTKKVQHVGGKMVRPGMTRLVDERDVPGFKPESKGNVEQPQTSPILSLLDCKVADIIKALPGLKDDELNALEEAENNGNTRKGVIKAIAEERLRRAAMDEEEQKRFDALNQFKEEVAAMDDAELEGSLELYSDELEYLAIVQGEIDSRKEKDSK